MRLAVLLICLSCSTAQDEVARKKLKDPACRDYVAVPGEPCRGDRYLWVGHNQFTPFCVCVEVPK
jgi:hypothetical protein